MASQRVEERRARLLDAVLDVLAEEGVGALSIRGVAARAGVSVAQVQYYFHTRAHLVEAAFERAGDQFLTAVSDVVPATDPTLTDIREIVRLWLPLDRDRERRARVWLAYSSLAATDDLLAMRAARLDADLRSWFSDQFAALQHIGDFDPQLDPHTTAAHLLALIDGLTIQALMLSLEKRLALVGPPVEERFSQRAPTSKHY